MQAKLEAAAKRADDWQRYYAELLTRLEQPTQRQNSPYHEFLRARGWEQTDESLALYCQSVYDEFVATVPDSPEARDAAESLKAQCRMDVLAAQEAWWKEWFRKCKPEMK